MTRKTIAITVTIQESHRECILMIDGGPDVNVKCDITSRSLTFKGPEIDITYHDVVYFDLKHWD